MSKNILTNQEQTELRSNEAVKSCTERYIIYTSTFKVKAVEQYHQGISAYQIFTNEGLCPSLVSRSKMKESIRRWKRTMDTQGIDALKKRTHRKVVSKK
jgi:hypothetical protein